MHSTLVRSKFSDAWKLYIPVSCASISPKSSAISRHHSSRSLLCCAISSIVTVDADPPCKVNNGCEMLFLLSIVTSIQAEVSCTPSAERPKVTPQRTLLSIILSRCNSKISPRTITQPQIALRLSTLLQTDTTVPFVSFPTRGLRCEIPCSHSVHEIPPAVTALFSSQPSSASRKSSAVSLEQH